MTSNHMRGARRRWTIVLAIAAAVISVPAAVGPLPHVAEAADVTVAGWEKSWDGKLKAAADAFQKSLEARPNGVAALVAIANTYFEMDKNAKAVKAAEKAVRLSPRNARAQLTLGTIYQTMGQNQKAKKAYHAYLKLKPKGRFAADVRIILKNL